MTETTAPNQVATRGQRWALPIVLAAVLVVPMSISGTAVALPSISGDLGGSPSALQWVVNLFNLTFACFTLVWGSLADRLGHARLFMTGAGIFAAGSLLSFLAPSMLLLNTGRGIAGLGGAAIFSCGSAILSSTFTGPKRVRAFALFGTMAGIGTAVGPTIGGLLTDSTGWRSVFVLHTVVLGIVLVASPLLGLKRPTDRATGRLDWSGAALLVLSLLALMTAIVQGNTWDWGSLATIGMFAAAVILFIVFGVAEHRHASPFLDLSLLRNPGFMAYCLVPVAASFGFVTLLTYLPSFLQFVSGMGSGAAGLTVLIMTFPVVVGPLFAGLLVQRGVRPATVIWISFAALIAGNLGLLLAGPGTAVGVIAVPLLLSGAGMGLSAGLVDGQALALVDERQAGMAAGVINTLRLGSEAIAVAVYASVLTALITRGTRARFGDDGGELAAAISSGNRTDSIALAETGTSGNAAEVVGWIYTDAFHATMIGLAVVVMLLAVGFGLLKRRTR